MEKIPEEILRLAIAAAVDLNMGEVDQKRLIPFLMMAYEFGKRTQ